MDEQKNNSSKTNKILEVVWNRKNSTRGSRSLPEMKEINIDDSARKVKMLSKSNHFSRDVNVSDCGIRKHAKRSLFQENKNEKVNKPSDSKKLNKKLNETSSRKKLNCSSEVLQISCPISPEISSMRNQGTLFQKSSQESKSLPDIKGANDNAKEIIKSSTSNNCSRDVYVNDRGIRKHPKKSLFQENKIEKVNEPSDSKKSNETSSRKKLNYSSEALKISYPISPEISSIRNQDTLFQKSSQESKSLPDIKGDNDNAKEIIKSSTSNNCSRDVYVNDRGIRKHPKKNLFQENKIEKVNEPSDSKKSNETSSRKKLNYSSEALKISCPISPEISSIRNQDTLFQKSSQESKSLPDIKGANDNAKEIIKSSTSNNCSRDVYVNDRGIRKHPKRSLFQENKIEKVNEPSDSKKSNETNSRKRLNYSSEALQISCPISPEISSVRNQDFFFHNSKQHSFKTEGVKTNDITTAQSFCDKPAVTSSCGIDKKDSFDNYLCAPASPVIHRKRKHIDSDIINFDKFNRNKTWIPQAPKKSIEKSSNVNTHLNQVQTKINYIDTEDIIESSETISSPKKHKTKRHKAHSIKKTKIKCCINGNEINELKSSNNKKKDSQLQTIECRKNTEIEKTTKNEFHKEINDESLDFINTENELKSPVIESKNIRRKSKQLIKEAQSDQSRDIIESCIIDAEKHNFVSRLVPSCPNSKVLAGKTSEEDLRTVKFSYKPNNLNKNIDKSISFKHSSEINVIPGTPENNKVTVDKFTIDYSPEKILNPNVPLIEVDQSPKTPHGKNHVHIQLVQTPPLNVDDTTLPGFFEPMSSPTQSFIESQLPFKIDIIESPNTVSMYENVCTTEMCKNKLNNSPSPNRFNSAKKRKKICKDGLRGQFQDLINRKKSEACIREYEKNLSKNYQPKEGETTLLNIIEVWKEFKTFVLLCYYMKSETEIQKVLVTLENCPKNATNNSVIRIYSPWLTIKSKNTELLLFVGVIHAEVVDFSVSTRPLEPVALFTNVKGLMTTVFQSEVLWECNCSKDTACQCLGESSTYNYLQYMVS